MELILKRKGEFYTALIDKDDLEMISPYGWYINNRNYVCAKIKNKQVLLHRFILGLKHGDGHVVDHVNLNRLDNRRENLRIGKQSDNILNRPVHKNNLLGLKGVNKTSDSRFRARIRHNARLIHIGYFKTAAEAAKAYDIKARELFGEYGRLNFQARD